MDYPITPDSQFKASLLERKLDEMTLKAQSLADALEGIIDEVPNSVEYSDWPELQELVEQAQAALANYRKGE